MARESGLSDSCAQSRTVAIQAKVVGAEHSGTRDVEGDGAQHVRCWATVAGESGQ